MERRGSVIYLSESIYMIQCPNIARLLVGTLIVDERNNSYSFTEGEQYDKWRQNMLYNHIYREVILIRAALPFPALCYVFYPLDLKEILVHRILKLVVSTL